MKGQTILSICIAGALLTACGSSGSAGTKPANTNSNTKPPIKNTDTNKTGKGKPSTDNSTNSKNPNTSPAKGKSEVPNNLEKAVKEALKFEIDHAPAPNHQSSVVIGNKSYNKGDFVYFTDFDLGYSEHNDSYSETEDGSTKGKTRLYRLPYSVIVAETITDIKLATNNSDKHFAMGHGATLYLGYPTKNLPQTGKANYTGKSFYNEETGNFSLATDFGSKKVNGKITGLSTGEVTLKEGKIQLLEYRDAKQMGFSGEALLANGKAFSKTAHIDNNGKRFDSDEMNSSKYNFVYSGHFFGPKAEEVGGIIEAIKKDEYRDSEEIINFAGQRGEIKQ